MLLSLLKLQAAVINTDPLPKAGLDPATGTSSSDLLVVVLNVTFGILAVISLITIVYGGFKYVISRGEPANIGKAKDIILYSVIGLLISFCAFGIVNLLLNSVFN